MTSSSSYAPARRTMVPTTMGTPCVEGDGSAWDSCCRSHVRDLIENPASEHIASVLSEFVTEPVEWTTAHNAIGRAKRFKLYLKAKCALVIFEICAIRRSGDRGASCLKFWIHLALWACSIEGFFGVRGVMFEGLAAFQSKIWDLLRARFMGFPTTPPRPYYTKPP